MSFDGLKQSLIERLIPGEAWRPGLKAARSDFDLNPGAERSKGPLKSAAVLIPIVAHAAGPTVLLTRRSDSLNSHSGQIAFPGGRLDPGETAVVAALREANEEIALDPGVVEVLGLSDAYETGTGFLITPVIGWISAPPSVKAQEAEVADIFETPWDFLMETANHRRDYYDPPEGGPRRHYWAMPWQERYIWGATAGVIRGLHTRLYGVSAEDAA